MSQWILVNEIDSVDSSVEDDWNRWYDEVHLPEMLECPGWVSAERYVSEDDSGRRYVSIYKVTGPGALQSDEFEQRRGWGPFAGKVTHVTRLYRKVSS